MWHRCQVSTHIHECGASAWEAMLSFEGSCIAVLALYGALMLLVKLLKAIGAVGMVKSLLRQEKRSGVESR